MSAPIIEVLQPGALTTVQDLGRFGYLRVGVTVGGAMDRFAAVTANILAGNVEDDAVLEITLMGPQLKFIRDTTIALTGADLTARVGASRIAPWSSVSVEAGSVMTFGGRASGARVYLAVSGGFLVPEILGSSSTDLKARFGGVFGRTLKAGDLLTVADTAQTKVKAVGGRSIMAQDLAQFRLGGTPIRILRYRGDSRITDDIFSSFVSTDFTLRPDSDRMGFRLSSERLITIAESDREFWSEPVVTGTIQLPPSGEPIILMADRQTVGGYPKLGAVISVDIGRLAQIAPGESLRFREVNLDEAQQLLAEESRYLNLLKSANP